MIDFIVFGMCIGTVIALMIGIALHFIARFIAYDDCEQDKEI